MHAWPSQPAALAGTHVMANNAAQTDARTTAVPCQGQAARAAGCERWVANSDAA